ncbi:MAG: response regulator, partial [Bdellovibrionales bacterium]|nr:response regulator [Bdellovibrionales bacterium]
MNEKIFGHSLIVGILLLTVTSISSLLLIFSLEKEVKTRSQALKAQHRAGDIDRALMEWMIYRLIAEKSKSEDPDSELASRLKHKVEVIQKDLEMSVIHDPIQFKRSQELKKNWGHFVQNLEDSGSRTEIRKLIRDIESYEQNKIDHFSPNINYKIKIMTVASIILLFASLIIVIQSFKNLKQKKLQQEEIIANLERSKKAADESSKLKSKFVATVSHEIRTPINGIVGATQVFSNHNLDETQKKLLRAINHSSKTLLNLVNELLDFSKLEAQKIQIQTKPIDLYAFCNEVIETMGWKAEEKNLKFYFDIDFDVHQFVLADENLLKQVIINLVGNALKFTNMGRVVLKIQMSNDHFKFIVEDTGIGISNDHIEKIFNPFFQSNQDSVYNEPGTGIGLTISQRLVQAMGGQIKVESVINKGTRFYFEIPLESLDEHKFKKDSPARLGFKNALQGFQILVAEDNETNRLVCSEIIKNQGAQATVVKNGQEAVDVASQKGFDVILLDCQMPILDGY